MKKLSSKTVRAIDFYLQGMTKKDAMIKAGYAESTASTKHSEIFGNDLVLAEIARRQKIAASHSGITLERLNKILINVAEANLGDLIVIGPGGDIDLDYSKLTPALKQAIAGFSIDEMSEGRGEGAEKFRRLKVSLSDKLRAIDLLIRHNGLSKEKVTVSVEGDLVERLNRGRARTGVAD